MKEQSHKDEMSAAIRGDFQRLRARGVTAELVPREPTAVQDTDSSPAGPPGDGSGAPAPVDRSSAGEPASPSPAAAAPTDEQPAEHPAAEPESDTSGSPTGWLGRLFGRE